MNKERRFIMGGKRRGKVLSISGHRKRSSSFRWFFILAFFAVLALALFS